MLLITGIIRDHVAALAASGLWNAGWPGKIPQYFCSGR
jgi:hypothetical protein